MEYLLEDKSYIPLINHRGDICVLLDTKENPTYTCRYDSFGEFTSIGSVKSPWMFSGQRYDTSTNFYHFLNRDYDSFTGRWLTPDPLGFADGPNLYAYVHNNPLVYVDPYGLWGEFNFNSNSMNTRLHGAGQMLWGTAEMGAGMAISGLTSGWAAPVGFAVGAHGSDRFCTGLKHLNYWNILRYSKFAFITAHRSL